MKDLFEYLYSLRNRGSSFGLERMEILVDLIGNPQTKFPVIHVAGTNGKGSVCSMLSSVYQENGYNVGLFTSPHLISLEERIKVNGEMISNEEIHEEIRFLKPIAEMMEKKTEGMHPTFFEFMTAVAFLFFKKKKVDLAILETGLGGRLDSTNVVFSELSIITTISLDHCDILGDTIEEIAVEKAGIIKSEKPVLVGWVEENVTSIISEIAKRKRSPLFSAASWDEKELIETNLKGFFQRQNATLAYKATKILESRFPVVDSLTRQALKKVRILGRWQEIIGKPKLILDACHNSAGAKCLEQNLIELNEKPQIWLGVLGKERAVDIVRVVSKYASSLVLFEVSQPRSCTFKELRSLIPSKFKGEIIDFDLKKATYYLSNLKKEQTILITGSIYLIGDILSILRGYEKKNKFNLSDLF